MNKRLTPENWLTTDPVTQALVVAEPTHIRAMIPKDYADEALSADINLPAILDIPQGVRELYAGAQACMAYAGFWHPFSGLALDLLGRCIEAAVILKARDYTTTPRTFHAGIEALLQLGLIDGARHELLHEIRKYRNERAHAKDQEYLGIAGLSTFRTYRTIIIDLWK